MGVKRLIKFMLVICLMGSLFSVVGCTTNKNVEGELVSISLADMQDKIENQDTFLLSLVTSECPYCQKFHELVSEYVKTHPLTVYEVMLDNEPTSVQENVEIITVYFPEFYYVPGVFYVVKGAQYVQLDTYNLGVSEEVFVEWLNENNIE